MLRYCIACGKDVWVPVCNRVGCDKPATVPLDHPLYEQLGVCAAHEPRRCSSCEGHILGGECSCEN